MTECQMGSAGARSTALPPRLLAGADTCAPPTGHQPCQVPRNPACPSFCSRGHSRFHCFQQHRGGTGGLGA